MSQTELGVAFSDFLDTTKSSLERLVDGHGEVDTSGVSIDVVKMVGSIDALMGGLDHLEGFEISSNFGVDGGCEGVHTGGVFSSHSNFFRTSKDVFMNHHFSVKYLYINCKILF
jgi:hypothetical protein